ncbi:MAG: tetratricopeptide repeat protein [Bacteroidota bacterium]
MRGLLFFLFLITSVAIQAQSSRLAQQYYRDGEFEKAAFVYKSLYEKNTNNTFYFERYVDCLIALEEFKEAEKEITKSIKQNDKSPKLYVLYGKLLERQYKDEEAKEQFQNAISVLPKDRYSIIRLANDFSVLTKYDLAITTYEAGSKLLKDDRVFAYYLGELYRRKGETTKMIEYYLNSIDETPKRVDGLKSLFQRYFGEEDYRELQRQLYERIQSRNENITYNELLTWVFIQRKDYRAALRQVKALDRRMNENGGRVFEVATIAANDRAYDQAIDGYEYIVEMKGATSSYYLDAKKQALLCRRQKLVDGYSYTKDDLLKLEALYEDFLEEFGRSKLTAAIILELAKLEAFYLNDLDKAITLLNEMINYPNIDPTIQAEGKLSLADYYLMQGERWESTLLYSQVDKDFKEDYLGNEARFRNAKLSYFMGEFEWAQSQFNILKVSTSKVIANDALDLSVFIMDNLGLDSTEQAIKLYSEAELLVFQNKFDEAFEKMDTLATTFPDHSLKDDILYLKADIYSKLREYEKAASIYKEIVDNHKDEIRADNALFALAMLYENQLNDLELAQKYYESLFIDFSNSTLAVEARKRYRILRGDNVQ